jgi:transcriptional regulator with XRE-family HTH domain
VADLRSPEEVARLLRDLRKRRGLSLAAFASMAGKPGQGPQFGRYEAGQKVPSLETLTAIAAAAEVPVALFYEGGSPTERISGIGVEELSVLRDDALTARAAVDRVLEQLDGALARAKEVEERRALPVPPLAAPGRSEKERRRA